MHKVYRPTFLHVQLKVMTKQLYHRSCPSGSKCWRSISLTQKTCSVWRLSDFHSLIHGTELAFHSYYQGNTSSYVELTQMMATAHHKATSAITSAEEHKSVRNWHISTKYPKLFLAPANFSSIQPQGRIQNHIPRLAVLRLHNAQRI